MKNPLERIKEEKHLTNREMAILLGQSVGNVSHMLLGNYKTIPNKTLKLISTFGYDPEEIQEEYSAFRDYRAQQLFNEKVAAV